MQTERTAPFSFGSLSPAPGQKVTGYWPVATDVDGRDISIPICLIHGKYEGPTLWIQACLHGDEYGGSWAVNQVAKAVNPELLRGTLVILPAVNVKGFLQRFTRGPIDGKDLNRACPGDSDGWYTDQIAANVCEQIVAKADYLIDVHTGTTLNSCTHFVFYAEDLPSSPKAREIAQVAAPLVVARKPLASTVIGFATQNNIPALFVSCGGQMRLDKELVDPLKQSCLNVMSSLGMLDGQEAVEYQNTFVQGPEMVYAHKGGFIVPQVKVGQWLEKDIPLITLYDIFGNETEMITCSYTSAVAAEIAVGVCRTGDMLIELFVAEY